MANPKTIKVLLLGGVLDGKKMDVIVTARAVELPFRIWPGGPKATVRYKRTHETTGERRIFRVVGDPIVKPVIPPDDG